MRRQDARDHWGFRTLEHRLRPSSGRRGARASRSLRSRCSRPRPWPPAAPRRPTCSSSIATGRCPARSSSCSCPTRRARCNDAPPKPLTSAQIIEARDLRRDLLELQLSKDAIPKAGAAQIFSFVVETEEGTLRYPDTPAAPRGPAAPDALRAARGDRHLRLPRCRRGGRGVCRIVRVRREVFDTPSAQHPIGRPQAPETTTSGVRPAAPPDACWHQRAPRAAADRLASPTNHATLVRILSSVRDDEAPLGEPASAA